MIVWAALAFFAVVLVNVLGWPRIRKSAPGVHPSLSVLIPARNEEQNLGACLDAVLSQGSAVREVLVCDDHSSDQTASIVEQYGARDPRVRLLRAGTLPAEWFGKNFACAQLAAHAAGDWLLFLDADARLRSGACLRMVADAEARRLTLLSAWPGFEMHGFWEGALMPMLNFVVFSLFPAPLSLVRNESSLGLAHGACMLANRAAYEALGGHTAVRNEIFEDTRLAQIWRERGERALCLDGQDVVSVRMYASFPEIWLGFQKNFYLAFQRDISFWAFLLLHLCVFLLPFLGLSWRAAAWILGARVLLAVRFRQKWWSPLTHPLGEMVLLALGLSSWRACRNGRGVTWKGRQYLNRA